MRVLILIGLMALAACGKAPAGKVTDLTLTTISGGEYSFQSVAENKATVLFFLSPECPLCQNYTLNINNLVSEYADEQVDFLGVVPGTYFTKEKIQGYLTEYDVKLTLLLDPDKKLTKLLGAKITPEVFVLSPKGDVLYSGKIDNWYITLGRNRKKPTEFYLKDALTAINTGGDITTTKTNAVGCYIE